MTVLEGHGGAIASACFSPDGRRILTTGEAGGDGTIRLWDVETGKELLALPGGGSASFSPDGRQILTAYARDVLLYDTAPINQAFVRPPGNR